MNNELNRRSFFGVFAATVAMPLGAALQIEGGEIARCKFGDKVFGRWIDHTDWNPAGVYCIPGRGEVPIEERTGTIEFVRGSDDLDGPVKVREFREIGHEERMVGHGLCRGEYSPHGLYIEDEANVG